MAPKANTDVRPQLSANPIARFCPLCGHTSAEIMFRHNLVLPEGLPLDAQQTIVCCSRCGFVYAAGESSQECYDRFYAQFSKYADPETYMGGGTAADVKRLQQAAAYLAQVVPDKGARILDIGCANGALLGVLQELGYTQLCGLDPSPACIQNIRQRPGIEAYLGSLSHLPAGLSQFSLVVLSHVLEHVRDVRPTLQRIHTLLSASGRVYVEVPDAARYADFVFSPLQEFNLEHINHFSLPSLAWLLETSGFCIIESGQKVIESAPRTPGPAVFVTGVKEVTWQPGNPLLPTRDRLLRQRLQAYIDVSQRMLTRIDLNLQRILAEHPRIIIWGTGQLVMKLLAETALAKAAITAFVDSNPALQGQSLNGIPILAPMQIAGQPDPIVIASTLYYEDIRQHIVEEMKLPNPILGLL